MGKMHFSQPPGPVEIEAVYPAPEYLAFWHPTQPTQPTQPTRSPSPMTDTRKTTAQPKPKPLTPETATAEQWRCFEVVALALNTYTGYLKPIPCGNGIRVAFLGGVATYDRNLLTRLVLAAHRYAVRISVLNSGPRRVAIEAYPRDPGNMCTMKGHPSLEDLKDMADAWQLMEEIDVADKKGSA